MALFNKEPSAPKPSVAPRNDGASGTAAFIGPNVMIDGVVTGSEPLLIEGAIKGRIDLQSDLQIGARARVEATVHARNVMVEGAVVGDISADNRVELVPTASVEGNIKAPKIVVAEGAKFRGAVDMGSARPEAGSADGGKGDADAHH